MERLKAKIQDKKGIPPKQQRFSCAAMQWKHGRTLCEAKQGRETACNAMERLKATIQDQEGIPPEQQRFSCAAMQCKHGRTLCESNIPNKGAKRPVMQWSA